MEFRIGPARKLAEAFCDADFDRLDELSLGVADFSLHLSPLDLDLLTEELCKVSGHGMLSFADAAGEPIAGDRAERCVFLLSKDFVTKVASSSDDAANEIGERWMERVAEECGNPDIAANADSLLAVTELIAICRRAIHEGHDVVYCWSL